MQSTLKSQDDKPSENLPGQGHNSAEVDQFIQDYAKEASEIDNGRHKFNKRMADMRDKAKVYGLDTQALHQSYLYYKASNHKKDGFDETKKISMEALNRMDQSELFAWKKTPKKEANNNVSHPSADAKDAAAKGVTTAH